MKVTPAVFVSLLSSLSFAACHQPPVLSINGIPYSTRVHWMRTANQAVADLVSACPFSAFDGLGELVCIGANLVTSSGNSISHGEIEAINNCMAVLTDPNGKYNLTASKAKAALVSFSLYTNAESCPMCASVICWVGFKEYIYGTSIDTLIEKGWAQIRIRSLEVFQQSFDLSSSTRLIGEVLTNKTDPFFLWQFDPSYPCPSGCHRVDGSCQSG
ncbi:guanine deaminase [Marasmius fiardii PR-910]|nr:guanine deaminase [Marasmius fiardii PR-910]